MSETKGDAAAAPRPPYGSRVWTLLNSPLGLFILSSVLVSGVARVYADRQHRLERERAREQDITKLATEVDYRAVTIHYLAAHINDTRLAEADRVGRAVLLWRAVVADPSFQATIPELRTIHTVALISRLKLLGVPSAGPGDVSDALAFLENGKDAAWHYDQGALAKSVQRLMEYRDAVNREARQIRAAW
jgi:hypothetical protein